MENVTPSAVFAASSSQSTTLDGSGAPKRRISKLLQRASSSIGNLTSSYGAHGSLGASYGAPNSSSSLSLRSESTPRPPPVLRGAKRQRFARSGADEEQVAPKGARGAPTTLGADDDEQQQQQNSKVSISSFEETVSYFFCRKILFC